MPQQLVPFLVVVAVLTVTPGPDMALVLRNGVRGGSRLAWWTGLGCCSGIAVHATAAVVGLSALLAASAKAYTVVRLAGAAYLVYLGVTALWHARSGGRAAAVPSQPPDPPRRRRGRQRSPAPSPTDGAGLPLSRAAAYRQGVLSNILNPKIALLFLTLLPQFVSPHEPRLPTSAVLAGAFLALAVLWWRVFSLGVGALGRFLSRERVRLWFERVTGAVLVALGVRVALERA
jgi:threonine/homoserine/homoserine lactone efflux protein